MQAFTVPFAIKAAAALLRTRLRKSGLGWSSNGGRGPIGQRSHLLVQKTNKNGVQRLQVLISAEI